MRETETDIQTNKEGEKEHDRLLGHVLHGLFTHRDMFSYMFSTQSSITPG